MKLDTNNHAFKEERSSPSTTSFMRENRPATDFDIIRSPKESFDSRNRKAGEDIKKIVNFFFGKNATGKLKHMYQNWKRSSDAFHKPFSQQKEKDPHPSQNLNKHESKRLQSSGDQQRFGAFSFNSKRIPYSNSMSSQFERAVRRYYRPIPRMTPYYMRTIRADDGNTYPAFCAKNEDNGTITVIISDIPIVQQKEKDPHPSQNLNKHESKRLQSSGDQQRFGAFSFNSKRIPYSNSMSSQFERAVRRYYRPIPRMTPYYMRTIRADDGNTYPAFCAKNEDNGTITVIISDIPIVQQKEKDPHPSQNLNKHESKRLQSSGDQQRFGAFSFNSKRIPYSNSMSSQFERAVRRYYRPIPRMTPYYMRTIRADDGNTYPAFCAKNEDNGTITVIISDIPIVR